MSNSCRTEDERFAYEELCEGDRRLNFWLTNTSPHFNVPGPSGAGSPANTRKKKNISMYYHINYNAPNGGKLHFHDYRDIQLDMWYSAWCALSCGTNNDVESKSIRPRLLDDDLLDGGEIGVFTEGCDRGAKLHIGGNNEPALIR